MLDRARELLSEFDVSKHPLVRRITPRSRLDAHGLYCIVATRCVHRANHLLQTRFTTAADGEHVGDDYFLSSGDKIRYFLEPSALSNPDPTLESTSTESPSESNPKSKQHLLVPPERSINKIGHALAVLDPTFRKHTLENEKIKQVARELGEHVDPRVLQSMIICKQPKIGGVVPVHNDSTFLYTDPPSAVGCWVALEECTAENGCLVSAS